MLVRPREAFVSSAFGEDRPIVLGPADILNDTHPHVRAYPSMFVEVRATVDDVEEMTARPGERRAARRPA